MTWQLIVHGDSDVRAQAAQMVRAQYKKHGLSSKIIEAPNVQHALDVIDEQGQDEGQGLDGCSLMIVGSTTPQDATVSSGLSGRTATKDLIRQLKRRRDSLVVIVLTTDPDDRLADFLDAYSWTSLVRIDADYSVCLNALLSKYCEGGEPVRGSIQLNIHLVSGAQGSSNWLLNRNGTRLGKGLLEIDTDRLQRLLKDSRQLSRDVEQKNAAWREDMETLATDLHSLLFQSGSSNIDCLTTFIKYRERAGGIRHARVRITVDEKTHPMLVEVLRDNGERRESSRSNKDNQFWMLDAPVYRRYHADPATVPPLFKDAASRAGPINALIIEADGAPGNIPCRKASQDADARLPEQSLKVTGLPNVANEAKDVADILASEHVHVHRLTVSDQTGDVGVAVLNTLRCGTQWHIVHFCGHLGSLGGEAGLILRGERDGFLSVRQLTEALDRVQLLFLSSCSSASAPEVMRAVEEYVPAVIGFQWVIDDTHAQAFAVAFYRRLFEQNPSTYRYVEYAFTKARSAVHELGPETPSWVSPVLVMQTA